MSEIKCIAFDCFGTVFDMAGVSRDEIKAYVDHVRKDDFAPFKFPASWLNLQLHPDAATGIAKLQRNGFSCVALSNGALYLLSHVSQCGGVIWDHIVDLAKHRVYKPHIDAYRTIEKDLGLKPENTLMVTANPTFGDIEGAAAIGMQSQVIRQPGKIRDIIELAELLGEYR
jgi:2-haloalkanoic acid dehalogenase type II